MLLLLAAVCPSPSPSFSHSLYYLFFLASAAYYWASGGSGVQVKREGRKGGRVGG